MEKEKISIIVPTYNVEKYISDTLDSITHQLYENIEVIIVDDGSTDDTLKVCRRKQKEDIRIKIIEIPHKGVSFARNTGIDTAVGDYIGFVDGDDLIMPEMYSTLIGMLKDTDSDVSEVTYLNLYENGFKEHIMDDEKITVLYGKKIISDMLVGIHFNGSANFRLIKAEIAKQCRFPKDMITNEDVYYTICCLAMCRRACFLNKSLYIYKKRCASASGWEGNRTLEIVDRTISNTKKIFNLVRGLNLDLDNEIAVYVFNVYLCELRIIYSKKNNINILRNKIRQMSLELKKMYGIAFRYISRGRRLEYWLLLHTKYGEYYLWKIINAHRIIKK